MSSSMIGVLVAIVVIGAIVFAFFKVSGTKRMCPSCHAIMPIKKTKCPRCGKSIPLNY